MGLLDFMFPPRGNGLLTTDPRQARLDATLQGLGALGGALVEAGQPRLAYAPNAGLVRAATAFPQAYNLGLSSALQTAQLEREADEYRRTDALLRGPDPIPGVTEEQRRALAILPQSTRASVLGAVLARENRPPEGFERDAATGGLRPIPGGPADPAHLRARGAITDRGGVRTSARPRVGARPATVPAARPGPLLAPSTYQPEGWTLPAPVDPAAATGAQGAAAGASIAWPVDVASAIGRSNPDQFQGAASLAAPPPQAPRPAHPAAPPTATPPAAASSAQPSRRVYTPVEQMHIRNEMRRRVLRDPSLRARAIEELRARGIPSDGI